MRYPDAGDDIIDSRDVDKAIEELTDLQEAGEADDDETELLQQLIEFRDEAKGYCPDWDYGEALICEGYFVEYAEQLAGDIGAVNPNADWPNAHIDWEDAADALKQDYTSADFNGETYWFR